VKQKSDHKMVWQRIIIFLFQLNSCLSSSNSYFRHTLRSCAESEYQGFLVG